MDNLTALRARDDLLAVAASWTALQARLRPQGSGSGDRVTGSAEPRLPIDMGVSDLLAEVEAHARFLGQVLLEEVAPEHGCDGACHGMAEHRCAGHLCSSDSEPLVAARDCPTRRDPVTTSVMPGLLVEVAKRYGHFVSEDERIALDFCDQAHELRRKVAGAIERKEAPRWQGPCPEDECPGEIYQRSGMEDAKCRECGRVVGPVEWRAVMEAAFDERLFTWSELVSALYVMGHQVSRETVATWVKRGKSWAAARDAGQDRRQPKQCLVPVVTDPDLYRWADAYELAERLAVRHERMTA
jgi:hypothetical protein